MTLTQSGEARTGGTTAASTTPPGDDSATIGVRDRVQKRSRQARAVVVAAWRFIDETVTGRGAVVALFAILGTVGGLLMSWTEFMALGVAALLLLLLAVPFTLGRGAHEVSVDLSGNRVVVGDPARARIIVSNPTGRSLAGAVVEMPVGRNVAAFDVPRLPGGASIEEILVIPTQRRSVHVLGPARTVRGDPVGLLRRTREWGERETLYVHPRTAPLDRVTTGLLRDLDGVSSDQLAADDVAFHALRTYVRGDDRRAVHWRSTARTGTLMVRQYEESRRWHVGIGLSTAAGDYATVDEFETAVSVAGSLGITALTDSRSLTVLTQSRGLRIGSPRLLLDQLAGVETESTRRDVVALSADLAMEAPGVSLAVLVVGSTVDVARLKSAHNRVPPGTSCIAVRVRPGETPNRGRLGDLLVVSVENLADLPRALRGALG
ncbi:DUF58 domain-containing protein [Dietzia natronolimnaea]|uniref:DUF58 domain-containing protein n=1 Tax=Dietzia natronolimnaea TaxID=161920 RepID=A0A2A2WQL2_9ACTN|nr:DUF58 domain-containing protein [Dietzia natronolimnaea]PAY23333.1 DUF58 domain-containing protein [Dietzia natronolimnaea]